MSANSLLRHVEKHCNCITQDHLAKTWPMFLTKTWPGNGAIVEASICIAGHCRIGFLGHGIYQGIRFPKALTGVQGVDARLLKSK